MTDLILLSMFGDRAEGVSKEYMWHLEETVDVLETANNQLKARVQELETHIRWVGDKEGLEIVNRSPAQSLKRMKAQVLREFGDEVYSQQDGEVMDNHEVRRLSYAMADRLIEEAEKG